MELEKYQNTMATLKKVVKIVGIVSLILGLVMAVLLVLFNFMGVFTIQTLPGTKYQDPFTYPGWQAIYWGVGIQIIQGYTEFTFNIWTCLGLFIPLLAIIVCSIIYFNNLNRKGTNMKKAILEIIMGVTIIFGAIMLFNVDNLAIANAQTVTDSYANYYLEYLQPAINGELSFTKEFYPYLILIVGLIAGLVKLGNGGVLIYQKNLAKKHKQQTSKETN